MQERRRFMRRDRARNGQVRFRGLVGFEVIGCVVTNFSAGGAQLLLPATLDIPPKFQLSIDGTEYRGCRARWKADGRMGVEFTSAIGRERPPASWAA